MLRKNAFIIYIKNKHNSVTGEIPPLIASLKAAISNLSGSVLFKDFQS